MNLIIMKTQSHTTNCEKRLAENSFNLINLTTLFKTNFGNELQLKCKGFFLSKYFRWQP